MTPILLSFAAFLSTTLGGSFALRFTRYLPLIMGFTAGVLVGLVAFDLLPEIYRQLNAQQRPATGAMVMLVIGFLIFHVAEKALLLQHAHETVESSQTHPQVGVLSALALSGHSFLDGVGIGLGFQVSSEVGIVVAIAVVAHDFCDGLNTVTLMLVHRNSQRRAFGMLFVDAAAPVLGAASTLLFTLPEQALPLYLGFFAGFLLYIGASDILPRAHRDGSNRAALALTILGTAFAFGVTRFA
jgi:zinc transporter ZupT